MTVPGLEEGPVPAAPQGARRRRLTGRLVAAVTVVGFVAPVAAYFWFVHHFAVNVIVGDQWDDVTVIRHSYAGTLTFGTLWAQHNENRIFFPNLVMLLFAHGTHLNVVTEELVSAVMLVGAVALMIWTHKRRSPDIRWIAYCPVAIVTLSFVQYENALWGFQMAWYLVLLAMMATMALIDRVTLTGWVMAASVATAIVASYSSLQGLLVWPAGLVLLLYRQRSRVFVRGWIVCAAVVSVLYFVGFNSHQGEANHLAAVEHPLVTFKFFFFAVGDVVGTPYHSGGNPWVILLGAVITVLAVSAVVLHGFRPAPEGGGPFGVALVLIGLSFDGLITLGRVAFGVIGASQSRYTTFDLLIVVGAYLLVIDGHRAGARAPGDHRHRRRAPRLVPMVVGIGVAGAVALQIGLGIPNGLTAARAQHRYQTQAVHVAEHLSATPDGIVEFYLYFYRPASFIRAQAATAQRLGLSMYAADP